MQPIRIRLPCLDERELAQRHGRSIAPGGIFLPTQQARERGEHVRFELCARDGAVLFSGVGRVMDRTGGSPGEGGLLLRFVRLNGPERATLDRLLLARDGLALALPVSLDPLPDGPPPPLPRVALALEIGGTMARAAIAREGRAQAVPLGQSASMPAAVALDEKGRVILGNRARARRGVDPASGAASPLPLLTLDPRRKRDAAEVARLPVPLREGDAGPTVALGNASSSASALYAEVAQELRGRAQEAAGAPLGEAWIPISPAYDDRARRLVRRAARAAGFAAVSLVDDALAIAAACGFTRESPPPVPALVIDWGGSTLSVAVLGAVEGELAVLASGLKRGVGGAAVDERIARMLLDRLAEAAGEPVDDPLARQRVLDAAEGARMALGTRQEVRVRIPWVATRRDGSPVDLDVILSAGQVQKLLEPALDQMLKVTLAVLDSAGVTPAEVAQVIAAGGQCGWPRAIERIQARFGAKVLRAPEPAHAAAIGAALLAERRHRRKGGAQAELTLGIQVIGAEGRLIPLFAPGTPLPARAALRLHPERGSGLFCALTEGASLAAGSGYLGSVRVGRTGDEVTLTAQLDERGMLEVVISSDGETARARMGLHAAEPGTQAEMYAGLPLP